MLSYIKTIRSAASEEVQAALKGINYSAISGKIIGDLLYSSYDYDGVTLPETLTTDDAPKIVVYSYSQKRELFRYGELENVTKIAFGAKFHVTNQGPLLHSYAANADGSINFAAPLSEYELPLNLVEGETDRYSVFYSEDEKYILWTRNQAMGIVSINNQGILSNYATFAFPLNTDLKTAYFLRDEYLSKQRRRNVYTIVGLLNTETTSTINVYSVSNAIISLESSLLLNYLANDLSVSPDLKRVAVVSNFVALNNQIYFYRVTSQSELAFLCSQTFNYSFVGVEYGPDNYLALIAAEADTSPILIGKIAGKNRSFFRLSDLFVVGDNSEYVAWDFSRDSCEVPLMITTASFASGPLLSVYLAGEVIDTEPGLPEPRFFNDTSFCEEQIPEPVGAAPNQIPRRATVKAAKVSVSRKKGTCGMATMDASRTE